MAEIRFAIHLELDPLGLAASPDPERTMAEASRYAATEHCTIHGLTLIGTEPIEIIVDRAFNPRTARDVVLVATMWRADGAGHVVDAIERRN